ncbi:hypothetical protein [Granulicella mallensis]|uniref:Uncharacterized protein n=1 Tax=Granulicella mallensis (strain ATCC BAA-1857 / DSM 23137 / MP5ACTX8) TaxID=682795 RepID=G8NSX4_GRAMM|nr:hypothetical protein [Granulicella mallensis]AEU36317.1 hypothetical protein AciX8_1987 [Granulicella mallensis MP5ACTX8]
MGQFDSPAEAALTRLKSEDLGESPVIGSVGNVTGIGAKILELLVPMPGFSGLNDIVTGLMGLAARKDLENLTYFGEAIIDDIRRLYRLGEEQRKRTESVLASTEFQVAVENATLYIVRTNLKTRLKRLANVITNAMREDDLDPEALDDMMRLAVTLTEADVVVLGIVYEMQKDMLSPENLSKQPGQRTSELTSTWQRWWTRHGNNYHGLTALGFKNSCARLLAAGLVGPLPRSYVGSPNANDLELLMDGLRFYERLQELN